MERAQIEQVYAFILVAVLLGLAAFFARRQLQLLQSLKQEVDLSSEDRRYHHRQAWRRLTCCLLMTIFALMLAGSYVMGWNRQADELGEQANAARAVDAAAKLEGPQKEFVNFFSVYWIIATLVLLGMVFLAALDIFAIRRFGLRHYRQIQSDRREMIEREVAQLRSQRNGHQN